ncbi:TetR/AcrR family transcriptional regulator [Paenibacillus solisilvae]|uniref:TetR/AcrR family transcriptional regulator n=1 Tax=Paenibacillus solisilvae TaxID=2486751 RepID=A0ABW0VVK7_9BACL
MDTDSKEHLRDERREQIKKAALKVFAQRGLIGTKMSLIAKEAKISDGLSYRYFKSKDEILVELVEEAVAGSNAAFTAIENMSGTALERMRTLTQEILQEDNHYFMLMQQVLTSDEGGLPVKVAQLMENYETHTMINLLTKIVSEGQDAGQFAAGDPRDHAVWYLTALVGLMNQETSSIEGYRPPDIDFIMRLIVKTNDQ